MKTQNDKEFMHAFPLGIHRVQTWCHHIFFQFLKPILKLTCQLWNWQDF